MLLSRKELAIVTLASVVFASITYRLVDKVVAMIPVVKDMVDVADDAGTPSQLGYIVHVVVFAMAVKWLLPRM